MRPGGAESLVGTIVGDRYLIERLLGEGGMGAVYLAQHRHMRKRVAVKVLHAEMSRLPEVVARFEREAMAAAHIEHPNVAAATDFGKLADGSFFLVLEYIEGKSLRSAIVRGPLELWRALHVVRQIAEALARSHALGIVHRDLKPENVMLVTRDGDPNFVKVLDFGIAKVPMGEFADEHRNDQDGDRAAADQPLTQLGMVYGTAEYMAPEQALGQAVDARADLYALGVMAFEMIVGSRPFEHESKVVLLGMHVTAPVPKMGARAPNASVPPEVDEVVGRLLAKDASARFGNAKELVQALDALTKQLGVRGRMVEAPLRVGRLPEGPLSANLAETSTSSELLSSSSFAVEPRDGVPGLASLVGASLGNVLRAAPSWMTRHRVLLFATTAVLLTGLFALAFGVVTIGKPARDPAASVTVDRPPLEPRPAVARDREALSAARSNIDKGDFGTAIDELLPIEKKDPGRAEVHALLEHAYSGVRNSREAMREAGLWLGTDPAAAADPKLEEDIRGAALLRDGHDEAFALLESKMGWRGIDLLYDIAFGASGRLYPQAAALAKRALDLEEVRTRASPALAVVLAFHDAKSCDQRHALLADVRDKGDTRMLPLLQPYESTRGCGFFGRSDCYPCMHKDRDLVDTVQALQDRALKAQ
jgi:eukaryotic-like serine/threonine-protein kinase